MNIHFRRHGFLWFEQLFQDIRFAFRTLRKSPGFTCVVVLTLALGIGANTVVFSVINALMLRELPYKDPDQLVMLWESNPKAGLDTSSVSGLDFLDWRDQNQVFQDMGAMTIGHGDLFTHGEAMPLGILSVSPGIFPVLGVEPAAGRFFTPEEEQAGKDRVIVLSYSLWKNHFNESREIIGETLTLDGQSRTVVGVMPPGQNYLDNYGEAYIPLTTATLQQLGRGARIYTVMARMKPGVEIEQARADMKIIAARLEKQYPENNKDFGVLVKSSAKELTSLTRPYILGLGGTASFVLLIVCVNTANLLLCRAILRKKETAIRFALGSNRFRIVRQVLTESLLLALVGGVVGFLLSSAGIELINRLLDTWGYRLWNEIRLDLTVFGFTLGLAGLAGCGFGLLPALYTSRSAPQDALKQAGRTVTPGKAMRRFLGGLTVAEMGLALVLLIGAGLLLRNLASLQRIDPGFDPDHVLCAGVSLPWARYPEGNERAQFYESALQNLQTLEQVKDIALTDGVPMTGCQSAMGVIIEGRSDANHGGEQFRRISDGYFRTLRIGLIKGRLFDQQDREDSTPVAIINQSMAHRYFGNDDPVGVRMTVWDLSFNNPRTIVGVVADERNYGLSKDPVPLVYVPYRQSGWSLDKLGQINFLIRTNTDPLTLVPMVRSQIARLDAEIALANINSLERLTLDSILPQRVGTWLLGVFAAVTLILSALGIYGVMSGAVNARTQEIGIRLAMGALPSGVIRLMLKRGLALAGLGCVVGIILALGATRFLSFLLYNVNPLDPLAFAGASVFLVAVALLACWLPARRAAKVDPMEVLRWE